ncbi:hypothetical protein AGMMS50276_32650 [Synergistales bacterium]|nr:hypothetical protein AGMMS50276_32650 [Synergistales bacterium]
MALTPKPEVILFGDDPGVAETAAELGVRHIPDIEKTESGVPLFSDAVLKGQKYASANVVAYVNSDIILFDDFTRAIDKCLEKRWSRYLLTGRRLDMDIKEPVDFFNPEWRVELRGRALNDGNWASPMAKDYFVFPNGMFKEMPPFAIGRPAFDNWMISSAVFNGIPAVDLSDDVLIVHQNHDYSHILHNGNIINRDEHPDSKSNYKMTNQYDNMFGHANYTTWRLTSGILRRRFVWKNTLLNLARFVARANPGYMRYEIWRIKGMFFVS